MFREQEDVYYYITVMNENYEHPAMPEGAEAGIVKGMYLLTPAEAGATGPRVQLMGSGTILREVIAAADLLQEYGVVADIWSCPSFTELRREGLEAERWNLLHPDQPPRQSYVEQCLAGRGGPAVAATDYMKSFADGIRAFVPGRYKVLGTDGYGRSDYRRKLRDFFEVDRRYVAAAALQALVQDGALTPDVAAGAIQKFGINADKPSPARS
jgi:pyruvate dehydrogenase E1 component